MSDMTQNGRGDVALTVLRFAVLATGSTLVGVLGHVVWRVATQ
jgi:hypothetical protein